MPGPGLPVNIGSTYTASPTDATVGLHQQHHDVIHRIVNLFDMEISAGEGSVIIGDGSTIISRTLLSTDLPGIVTNSRLGSYTLVPEDAGKLVELDSTAGNSITVPANSVVPFPIGTVIGIRQYGIGTTTVSAAQGVIIRSRGGSMQLAGQYAEAALTKRTRDEWILAGDLA